MATNNTTSSNTQAEKMGDVLDVLSSDIVTGDSGIVTGHSGQRQKSVTINQNGRSR